MDIYNLLYGEEKMQMDRKQTSLLALTVLAFGFLGYQIYQLIGNDLSQTTPAAPTSKLISTAEAAPVTPPLGSGSAQHAIHATTTPQNPVTITPVVSNKLPTVTQAPLLKNQQQYLELLNQYELLKMRRQMLEEQAAIAQAQNRIAVLNSQTRKLDASVNPLGSGSLDNPSQNSNYQLSYIDQQNGQWTASIYHNGAYQVVNTGSILSDGNVVKQISQQGVIIQNKKERHLISFNGLVALPPGDEPKPTPVPKSTQKIAMIPAKPQPKPVEYNWQAKNIFSLEPTDNSAPALDERKVLSIAKGHYTIQLMGSYNKDIVDNFIKANELQGKAFLYAVPSRDKYWYILILGDYSDLAHAKTALENLPHEMKSRGSWIRQYGEIQHMMRG